MRNLEFQDILKTSFKTESKNKDISRQRTSEIFNGKPTHIKVIKGVLQVEEYEP